MWPNLFLGVFSVPVYVYLVFPSHLCLACDRNINLQSHRTPLEEALQGDDPEILRLVMHAVAKIDKMV